MPGPGASNTFRCAFFLTQPLHAFVTAVVAMMQQQSGVKSHGVPKGQTELDGIVQENAAAFYVQLTGDEKAYLEEIFTPDKVGPPSGRNFSIIIFISQMHSSRAHFKSANLARKH